MIAVAVLGQSTPAPLPIPCHIRSAWAIGCYDPSNAADLYQRYRDSNAEIGTDYTGDYIRRFECARIPDHAKSYVMTVVSKETIATDEGYVETRFIIFKPGGRVLWVAAPYFDGPCPVDDSVLHPTSSTIETWHRSALP